jgi:putative membrane-bound dehydrogenase-like protein
MKIGWCMTCTIDRRPHAASVPLAIGVALLLAGCGRSGPPYSPSDALKTFRIEPDFRIERFLAEPAIRSPVDIEWDEDGFIYVVEDPGYPLNTEGKVGRVIRFEDTNGDGRPDRRTVFADKLTLPTGVMRWKKGVLVTDAPDVLYLEDTNNDGMADIRRVVLTGFAFTNPQHTVNNPEYGLDNWIYLAHEGPAGAVIFTEKFGDRGSDIRFPDAKDASALRPAPRMIRFRPDTRELEYLASSTQFGHSFDAWGRHLTVSNEDHIRQEVIAARYLTRNPQLPVSAAMARISDHGAAAEVYPIAQNTRVEMLSGVGSFTSACGIIVYLGGAFPSSPGLFSLTAEPAQSLVHRDVLTAAGAVYMARRARENVEFLASTDAWFRPVNLYIGPDGAIYLSDFYRLAIEHPEWMATHTHHSPDLYKGEDRGRIYRIVPDSKFPLPGRFRLSQASDEQLVSYLASPNIWWRRTAQRLLVDRQSARAVEPLVKLLETTPHATGRLHALWTLEGLGKLDEKTIAKALTDAEAGVRENAIVLAESHLKRAPELVKALVEMENDPDPRVQFQLLCTLGGIDSKASITAQKRLLAKHIENPWMQVAALSAPSNRAPGLFQAARAFTTYETEARARFFRQAAAVIAARRKPDEVRQVLETVARPSTLQATWWRVASLEGLAQGMGGGGRGAQGNMGQDLLIKLFEGQDKAIRRASLRLLGIVGLPANSAALLKRAAAAAERADADADLRADCIGLLAMNEPAPHVPLLRKMVDPRQPEVVQAAAVRALGRVRGPDIGAFIIERWRAMTPTVRMDAADAMFSDPSRPRLLVEAIKGGRLQPWTLAFRHKRNLLMSRDAALREEARSVLEENAGDREKVLARYQAALTMDGDTARGKEVFNRVCGKCHRFGGAGHEVGPDLATIRTRPPQLILADIIMPNRSIAQGYESYVVETRSSGIVEGVIGAQTPTTVTIRQEEGRQEILRREDIVEMRVTNLSGMPEDLDQQVNVRQMADLLKYLKSAR